MSQVKARTSSFRMPRPGIPVQPLLHGFQQSIASALKDRIIFEGTTFTRYRLRPTVQNRRTIAIIRKWQYASTPLFRKLAS
jgi:hypothetical protein